MTVALEIVGAQVRLNQLVPDWRTADTDAVIATGIQVMDAVGVHAAPSPRAAGLIRRCARRWGPNCPTVPFAPSFRSPERAVAQYPDRFAYLVRVDVKDPELERIVGEVRARPCAACASCLFREEVASFERGELTGSSPPPRRLACRFAWLPGQSHLLVPYLRKFPKLQFILDYCGVGVAPSHTGQIAPTLASFHDADKG
jgi:hypothetical protein